MTNNLFTTSNVTSFGAPMLPGAAHPEIEPNRLIDGEFFELYNSWLSTADGEDAVDAFEDIRRWFRRNTDQLDLLKTYGNHALEYAIADGVAEMIHHHVVAGLDEKQRLRGKNEQKDRAASLARHTKLIEYTPDEPIVLPAARKFDQRNPAGFRTFDSVERVRYLMLTPKYDMLRHILAQKRWPNAETKNFATYEKFFAKLGCAMLSRILEPDCTKQEQDQLKRRLFEAETMALIFRAVPGGHIQGSWPMIASNRLSIGRYRKGSDVSTANAIITFPQDDIALPISITQNEHPETRQGVVTIGRQAVYPLTRPVEERILGRVSLALGGEVDDATETEFANSRASFILYKIYSNYVEALRINGKTEKYQEIIGAYR